MSTVILSTRAVAPSVMVCETCTSAMTVSANPYFGTGLAVHRHIAVCEGCGAVAFVPEPEPKPSLMDRLIAHVRSYFGSAAAA